MRPRRTESALVGREGELARLIEMAEAPATGAVLLTGPAGVGKSRLAEGVLISLADRGWRGVGLSATDSASRVPYSSLSELIPDTLDSLDGEGGELRVQRAVESSLGLAQPEPVAIVIDDVAAMDPQSCSVLVHLATNRRLFIIATQGIDESLPEALRRLTPAAVVETKIEPLDVTGTAELAADLVGGPVGPGLVRDLYSRSLGNPLFVTELVNVARAEGLIEDRDGVHETSGVVTISPSLGRQIVFRFGPLDQSERTALELLALAGELSADMLAEVVPTTQMESMERRGLVRSWTDRQRLRIAVSHPLQAEAIVADMTPLEIRRRWGELAELIGTSPGRRDEDSVLHGLATIGSGRALGSRELLDAAYVALRLDRIRDAARLAEAAYESEPNETNLTGYSEALIRQGRFVEAEELLAGPIVASTSEWDQLHRAIRRSSNHLWGFQDAREAWRIDEECLGRLTDPDARDRVVAHQAWIEYCDGRSTDALRRTESLRGSEHPEVRFAVAAVRAPAFVLSGRVDEAAELAQRAFDEGWGADTEFGSHNQHLIALGFAKLYQGDVGAARYVAEAAIAVCRERQETTALLFFLDLAATAEVFAGNLVTALSYYEEAIEVGGDMAIATSLRSSIAGSALCCAQMGRSEKAAASWRRIGDVPAAPSPRGRSDEARAEVWVTAATGDPAEAAELARSSARRLLDEELPTEAVFLAFEVARLGYADDELAELVSEASEECQGPLFVALEGGVRASAERSGADLDSASRRLSEMGLALWGSELAALAGEVWTATGDSGRATASRLASNEAQAMSEGAKTPGLARVASVEPLSRREREVAVLAAAGASNSEIAEQLHLSVRTVETHLQRVYRKLGISGRGELPTAFGSA